MSLKDDLEKRRMLPKPETKLKTLKDLEEDPIAMQHCNHVVSSYDLKKEAIKWVEELRRKTRTTGSIDYRLSFKEFFNITEEDLK